VFLGKLWTRHGPASVVCSIGCWGNDGQTLRSDDG
jgi:hypothetical protein